MLQQIRQQSSHALLKFDDDGTVAVFLPGKLMAAGNVHLENGFHLVSLRAVVDKGVGLKIQIEAADIEIGGAYGSDLRVHGDRRYRF